MAVRAGGGERQALLVGLGAGVGVGELAVLLADAGDVGRLRLGREQARDDADGAAGVGDVDGLAALVARVDLHRGVHAAGGGAADQQRDREAVALHLGGDVRHLVERRGDEAGEADDVDALGLRGLEDLRRRHHDAEVDDLVVVAGEDDADDVLADVVHVALDRRHQDLAGALARRRRRSPRFSASM